MECELPAAAPAARTAWPGSEEDSGWSCRKKGNVAGEVADVTLERCSFRLHTHKKQNKNKQKNRDRKYRKRSISHSSRRQVLSRGTALLSVSSQQDVTATSAAALNEITS